MWLAATVLAVLCLFYSLRGLDWREVGGILSSASPGLLTLAAVSISSTLFLRALRWRILLNAAASVSVSTAFWASAAGSLGNNFLPGRAGELVRTVIVASRSSSGHAFALATVICERLADVVALALISAVVLLLMPSAPGWFARAAAPFAGIALAGAVGLMLLPRLAPLTMRTIALAPLSVAARERVTATIANAIAGLESLHDSRRLGAFVACTGLIWGLDAVGTMVGGAALGLRIPLPVAFLLIAGLGLGSTLPSTPGYVGIYQFVAVGVLTPFGFSRDQAIAYILVGQAMMYIVIGIWGLIALQHFRRTASTHGNAGRINFNDTTT
jgi:uncharacterized protein (TIRG00374 family)